eukprot:CAMPEP_0115827570 /NCGR_PEP_ID=MMETSP0287-20121206/113_1 /TAXON_ID=412157 /ORGANISM="Chrysochromulina rotalis, Strain UIO044" /LENGTH=86 /DNA_ID=CAMNT_0003280733 /DNA_START=365 /DNA_END=621 /DNA_ORIENTATION=-
MVAASARLESHSAPPDTSSKDLQPAAAGRRSQAAGRRPLQTRVPASAGLGASSGLRLLRPRSSSISGSSSSSAYSSSSSRSAAPSA